MRHLVFQGHRRILSVQFIFLIFQSVFHQVIYTDVALDPYSSDGHDGIVREDGKTTEFMFQILLSCLKGKCGESSHMLCEKNEEVNLIR